MKDHEELKDKKNKLFKNKVRKIASGKALPGDGNSLSRSARHGVSPKGQTMGSTHSLSPAWPGRAGYMTSLVSQVTHQRNFFIYSRFYVAFNTVQVISQQAVERAEETSTYSWSRFCTVNC